MQQLKLKEEKERLEREIVELRFSRNRERDKYKSYTPQHISTNNKYSSNDPIVGMNSIKVRKYSNSFDFPLRDTPSPYNQRDNSNDSPIRLESSLGRESPNKYESPNNIDLPLRIESQIQSERPLTPNRKTKTKLATVVPVTLDIEKKEEKISESNSKVSTPKV